MVTQGCCWLAQRQLVGVGLWMEQFLPCFRSAFSADSLCYYLVAGAWSMPWCLQLCSLMSAGGLQNLPVFPGNSRE